MRVRMHHGIYGVIFTILFFTHHSYCWQTITGKNDTRGNNTFSFPTKTYVGLADLVYCYALVGGQAQEYALSCLKEAEGSVRPFAPEKVRLNGIKDQLNPLYNSSISGITNLDEYNLLIVLKSEKEKLCGLSLVDETEVITVPSLSDANGQEVDQPVCALAGGRSKAFVAVKGNGQKEFGCDGSGIALLVFERRELEEEVSSTAYEELKKRAQDHDQQALEEITQKITTDKDGKYKKKSIVKKISQEDIVLVTRASIGEKIKVELSEIEDAVALHWDDTLQCLYVGLKVKAAADESAHVIGLFTGHINEHNKLILNPFIAPDLVNPDQIVAGKGSNAQVSIHKIASMLTTTYLNYCIIQGARGNSKETQSYVYALPILNYRTHAGTVPVQFQSAHGTVADYHGKPLEVFSQNERAHIFMGRHFVKKPDTPEQLCTSQTNAACVGAGQLAAGPIDDIFVKDDAVYAVVNNPVSSHSAGIYYSQAIFDDAGRIAAWTAWKPKAIIDEKIENATVIQTGGAVQVATSKSIKRSAWVKNTEDSLSDCVSKEFSQSLGGVHGLVDFSSLTPGIANGACLAILGSHKVMLARYKDHCNAITFTDSVLGAIGPLSTAEIIFNDPCGWLIVGGVHGLGLLCDNEGNGWHSAHLNDSFSHLSHDMHFKRIGNYQFVRKVIADEQYLYILTDTELDRIDVYASDFARGRLNATRLASMSEFAKFGIFKDVVISEKFALLATSDQLYRVGNGKDIRLDNALSMQWTRVEIPGAAGPVCSMLAISVNGRMQDVARASAGQIYIITGSAGKNVSRVHRFAVSKGVDGKITDTTLMPLRDFIAENTYSYYANVGNFSSLFATDGTLFFTQGIQRRNKIKKQVLVNSFGKGRRAMPLNLDNDAIITCIARSSASGNWMVGGDFGLFINE